jgi:hypothetical protein
VRNKKKKKRNKKRTPEQQRALREKRRRNRLNKNKVRDEFLKKEALKKEKERLELKAQYDKISIEDFEKTNYEFFEKNKPEWMTDTPDKTTKKMEKFFDEFSKRGNFMKNRNKGYFHSFIHENGYVLLTNRPTKEEKRNEITDRAIGGENLTEEETKEMFKHSMLAIDDRHFNKHNRIRLEWIVSNVDNRGKGWGTKTMNVLIELAKEFDYSISLKSAGNDKDFVLYNRDYYGAFNKFLKNSPLSTTKLINWYRSLGFDLDPRQAGVYRFASIGSVDDKPLSKTLKNEVVERVEPNLLYPSGSVEENIKFPSLKGYDGRGFDYSSTSKCFNNWILK